VLSIEEVLCSIASGETSALRDCGEANERRSAAHAETSHRAIAEGERSTEVVSCDRRARVHRGRLARGGGGAATGGPLHDHAVGCGVREAWNTGAFSKDCAGTASEAERRRGGTTHVPG
jgi:hypothetical protein